MLAYGLLAAVRLGLTRRFHCDSYGYALLNPLAWAMVVGIGVNSAWRLLSRRGATWKGRVYGQGEAGKHGSGAGPTSNTKPGT